MQEAVRFDMARWSIGREANRAVKYLVALLL
jgi:hypothetical protein